MCPWVLSLFVIDAQKSDWFAQLILFLVTLLDLFIIYRYFWKLPYSLQIGLQCLLFLFLSLCFLSLALSLQPVHQAQGWKGVGVVAIPFSFLTSVGWCWACLHLEWCWLWFFHVELLLCWAMIPLSLSSLGLFIMKTCQFFIKGSSCVHWNNHVSFGFKFIYLVYYIYFYCMLNHPCIPEIKPTWSWWVIFWYMSVFCFKIFYYTLKKLCS